MIGDAEQKAIILTYCCSFELILEVFLVHTLPRLHLSLVPVFVPVHSGLRVPALAYDLPARVAQTARCCSNSRSSELLGMYLPLGSWYHHSGNCRSVPRPFGVLRAGRLHLPTGVALPHHWPAAACSLQVLCSDRSQRCTVYKY